MTKMSNKCWTLKLRFYHSKMPLQSMLSSKMAAYKTSQFVVLSVASLYNNREHLLDVRL